MEQPADPVPAQVREPEAPQAAKQAAPAVDAQADSADTDQAGASVALDAPEGGAASSDIGLAQLEGRIIEAISEVYDPEIPVNIYEMGLIYDLHITADHCVRVQMTLTSPACPVAGSLPGEVEAKIRGVEGVNDVVLELVWDPPWTPDRMTEAAKLELGFM